MELRSAETIDKNCIAYISQEEHPTFLRATSRTVNSITLKLIPFYNSFPAPTGKVNPQNDLQWGETVRQELDRRKSVHHSNSGRSAKYKILIFHRNILFYPTEIKLGYGS